MTDEILDDEDDRALEEEERRLAALLRPLAFRPGAAPSIRGAPVVQRHTGTPGAPRRDVLLAAMLAAAAGLLLVAAMGLLAPHAGAPTAPTGIADPSTWVASSGPVYSCAAPEGRRELRAGSEVTASGERVTIELAGLGTLTAEPDARLSVVSIGEDLHRLRLERGTVHAVIRADARPRLFQVETPASLCVDLGCLYTLSVDDAGNAHVRVTAGRVSFEDAGREVYVPAGASCRATPGRGAGLPVWEDAPEIFERAARAFDEAPASGRAEAARALAGAAERAQDSLTLYHLLLDADAAARAAGLEGIAHVDALPEGISRQALLSGDATARAALRAHLERWW